MGSARTALLVLSILVLATMPITVSADSDGDGVSDSTDDCIWSSGTSSVDRVGCPDRDGDGISDYNDGWAANNPNFQNEFTQSSSQNYIDVDLSGDDQFVVTGDEDGWVRIWNSTTHVNVRSAQAISGGEVTSVAYSPDNTMIAAGLDDDTIELYSSSSMTSIYGKISVDVGSGDYVYDVEFSPDSSLVAVSIGRSGNGGTNGQVIIIQTSNGQQLGNGINPNGEDRFYASTFSPDGTKIAVAANGDFYIVDLATRSTDYSISSPPSGINDIDWSPDGNYISMCGAWEGAGASLDMYKYVNSAWTLIWEKPTTSSCLSADFSSDSKQIANGHSYYQGDGGSVKIHTTDSGQLVDFFGAPAPNGCGGNNCGQVNGLTWSSDGTKIITAYGRDDEGVHYWIADLDEDNDGYNSSDQGDGVVDAFPYDGTQWNDTDSDGYGDNPDPATNPDACLNQFGTSTQDRFGCPDTDGDGWSDAGDWAPNDSEQWADNDGDGYGDQYYYDVINVVFHTNQRGDAFPTNPTQWNDSDSDGWGDNYNDESWDVNRSSTWPGLFMINATQVDKFPLDHYQWEDTDGDWYGDNQFGDDADGCPDVFGNSTADRYGCLDTDGDTYSDPTANWGSISQGGYCQADGLPLDPTQWCDRDSDGYGDNPDGNSPDECPDDKGYSFIDRDGCIDTDGDGYSDQGDPFPNDDTQWENRDGDSLDCGGDNQTGLNPDVFPDDSTQCKDTDGDGYGDNAAGNNGDVFKNDPTQWSDFDGDGYGDNNETGALNGDICPTRAGNSPNPLTRGCPDTDGDGFVDPEDAFPENPLQWSDQDGDGYGDEVNRPGGDDCPDLFGLSNENNRYGCLDSDGDGWADVDDTFPQDGDQWVDTDGDGYGDNYLWTLTFIEDQDNPERIIELRQQSGDAFPDFSSEWSDQDGDGYGDNFSDAFPLEVTQWNDQDDDGYGDNFTSGAFQPDDCETVPGQSYRDVFGCLDSDLDGMSDTSDPCPWDPEIFEGRIGSVKCSITEDPNSESNLQSDSDNDGQSSVLIYLGIAIVALLSIIIVAQFSKTLAKSKSKKEKLEEIMVNDAFSEDEERRTAWIDYYVANGQLDEAKALGWVEQNTAELPQWKQFEIQQQQEQDEAIPTMVNLDDIL
ncbi:MAG: hypothetical protein ACJ0CN_05090 [Candidatus Poseidoniaceae archaeon]